jgi:hypothetical protein
MNGEPPSVEENAIFSTDILLVEGTRTEVIRNRSLLGCRRCISGYIDIIEPL